MYSNQRPKGPVSSGRTSRQSGLRAFRGLEAARQAVKTKPEPKETKKRLWSKPFWLIPFWLAGEFTTHFRTDFSGDWDVHWGYDLDFDPINVVFSAPIFLAKALLFGFLGLVHFCRGLQRPGVELRSFVRSPQ